MFAKKVFFSVVVLGASYLGFQLFKGTVQEQQSTEKQVHEQAANDMDAKISALQDQIDYLKHEVVSLRHQRLTDIEISTQDAHRESNDLLGNDRDDGYAQDDEQILLAKSIALEKGQNTSLSTPLDSEQLRANAEQKTTSETNVVKKQNESESALAKRIRQQTQLRAIAEKHELAALSVLVSDLNDDKP